MPPTNNLLFRADNISSINFKGALSFDELRLKPYRLFAKILLSYMS
jgi:hypothetical protein